MFEGMLARRYITAQKRHSALTVCSIAMALALITMMFSLFSSVMSSLRNIAYDQGEFHIRVTVNDGFTKEEYDAFAEAISEYADCTPDDFIWGESGYWADVTFKKYINDYADSFVQKIGDKIGFDTVITLPNDLLMMCDMIDLQSALKMAQTVALFYVFVLFLIMMLRLIIDTAFEISSRERERQLGVLQSVGATPRQIVRVITYEGLMLSAVGIPLGVGAGIGLGYLAYRAVLSTHVADLYLSPAKAAEFVRFTVNPWLLLLGIVTGAMWVFLSAYGTGMRVIKKSPVQAISQRSNTVKEVHKMSLFGKLFGWTGKLASRNNLRQPKRFIASVVALTLSIALFSAVTVVTNDLQSATEEQYEWYTNGDGDFYVSSRDEDPLIYGKQMELYEESGLFSEVNFTYDISGGYSDPAYNDGKSYISRVIFYNRNAYQKEFNGNSPVSYDELSASGGYILSGTITEESDVPNRVSLEFDQEIRLSVEEYNALSDEEKEFVNGYLAANGVVTTYLYDTHFNADFEVYATSDHSKSSRCMLIGTFEQYKNGEYERLASKAYGAGGAITCFLADEDDYFEALSLIDNNKVSDDVYYYDNTAEIRKARAMLTSIRIGATFISILIALIAVVNMVNILATGILNRRGELAAMQCVGMTEKQLYKMTAIECLEYALTSGIAAVAVCELMMFLTGKMLKMAADIFVMMEYYINYLQPLPIIGIASVCAFVIAVVASIIPLRAMRKTSLVDQIRSVE